MNANSKLRQHQEKLFRSQRSEQGTTDFFNLLTSPDLLSMFLTQALSPDRSCQNRAWLPYDSWANGPVEYLLKKAVPGEFKAKAVYWSDDGVEGFSPIGVRVDFYIDYGRANEKHVTSVFRLERVDEEYVVGKVKIPASFFGDEKHNHQPELVP